MRKFPFAGIELTSQRMVLYCNVSVLFLLLFWCPCMAINVRVQYSGGLLPDIILFKKNLNASKPSEHPPQVEEECLKV